MKPQELYKGIKVVVSDFADATVYTVETVNHFSVELTYTTSKGQKLHAGVLDACFLKLPTIQQLANA